MSIGDATSQTLPRLRLSSGSPGEALFHVGVALALLGLAAASFLVSTVLGAAVTFVLTLALAVLMPHAMPVVITCSFLFQNLFIAMFTPMVAGGEAFDTMRQGGSFPGSRSSA